ncbi:MAG: type II toxin-antitoxin system VapC family toxin [Verrucomicrobia bacterium]|nr:type II toxin-antitoxin system VapC family toxin [Verrucomicrobiota bacterium]
MKAVFDTNILIDYLQGAPEAKKELALYAECWISLISWMEVLVGAQAAADEQAVRQFLQTFQVHPVDRAVAERAVSIRRANKLRLPDAIIWATAQHLGHILVTRNTRDFPSHHPAIRVPYKV